MTLQQLRCLCEVAKHRFNLSRTAIFLNSTQPGISRMIRSLEEELGVELLVRSGTRILGATAEGEIVISRATQILQGVQSLELVANEKRDTGSGVIKLGATHTQAYYLLVNIIKRFTAKYPKVDLYLRQGSPAEVVRWVADGEVDAGLSSFTTKVPKNVFALDINQIQRCVIAPVGHEILTIRKPSIFDIAKYPLIMNDSSQTGSEMRSLFKANAIVPRVIVNATDTNVVMAYVKGGVGIAIVQNLIFSHEKNQDIGAVDVNYLFPPSATKISLRKDGYLRGYMYEFITMIAPHLERSEIDKARNRR